MPHTWRLNGYKQVLNAHTGRNHVMRTETYRIEKTSDNTYRVTSSDGADFIIHCDDEIVAHAQAVLDLHAGRKS